MNRQSILLNLEGRYGPEEVRLDYIETGIELAQQFSEYIESMDKSQLASALA